MHYTFEGQPIITTQSHQTLRQRLQTEVVPEIPPESWKETSDPLPLRYDTDLVTIVRSCLPFCTGSPRTDAVYVLECLRNSAYQQTAAVELGRSKNHWRTVESAERLIYVGGPICSGGWTSISITPIIGLPTSRPSFHLSESCMCRGTLPITRQHARNRCWQSCYEKSSQQITSHSRADHRLLPQCDFLLRATN